MSSDLKESLTKDLKSDKYALAVVNATDSLRNLREDKTNKYGAQIYEKQRNSYESVRNHALEEFNKKYKLNGGPIRDITWSDIQLVDVAILDNAGNVIYEDGKIKMGVPTRREMAKLYNYPLDPLYDTLKYANDFVPIASDKYIAPSWLVIILFIILLIFAVVFAVVIKNNLSSDVVIKNNLSNDVVIKNNLSSDVVIKNNLSSDVTTQ